METVALEQPLSTGTSQTLTAADRCDACGAQAFVRVRMSFGELLFCAHHAREHQSKIDELAIEIVDERARIAEL